MECITILSLKNNTTIIKKLNFNYFIAHFFYCLCEYNITYMYIFSIFNIILKKFK